MKMKNVGKKEMTTAKIAAIYTITNVVTRGMAFLTTPIFTRLMSKAEYGQFSNIASWTSILIIIATADLYSSISRAKYDFEQEINEYLSSIMLLSNIITLILYAIIEWNLSFFTEFFSMESIYIRFIFIYLIFWPASQFLQTKSQMFREYKSVIAISCLSFFSSTIASIVLVWMMENKLLGRVIGNYLFVALVDVILWSYILYRGKRLSKKFCIYALKLSVPLIPHNLAGNLLISSDRIIINKLCGAEDAALYSLAYTIAMIASLILSSLNQAWLPWLYDKIQEDKKSEVNSASIAYIGVFAVFALGIMLAAPEIVLIFGGSAYYEVRFVIVPVVMGIALQFIYTLYVNIEFYLKKTYLISCGTVFAALINIILNYICIPKWGYIAAAYTTLGGYLCMAIFHYLIVRLKFRPYLDLYNKKAIIMFIIFFAFMMPVCLILYCNTGVRYIFIFLFLLCGGYLFYKKRNEIRLLLRK